MGKETGGSPSPSPLPPCVCAHPLQAGTSDAPAASRLRRVGLALSRLHLARCRARCQASPLHLSPCRGLLQPRLGAAPGPLALASGLSSLWRRVAGSGLRCGRKGGHHLLPGDGAPTPRAPVECFLGDLGGCGQCGGEAFPGERWGPNGQWLVVLNSVSPLSQAPGPRTLTRRPRKRSVCRVRRLLASPTWGHLVLGLSTGPRQTCSHHPAHSPPPA